MSPEVIRMHSMSEISNGIDGRAFLSSWLGNLTNMYLADINAIPDDKWTATFGGCTRPASVLTADALSLIGYTTGVLTGSTEGGSEEEQMAKLTEACATKESACATFSALSAGFSEALAGASDEALLAVITTPFGMTMPLYAVAQIAVSHIWYHDGQLNYIQCLLGDEKVHWM